MFIPRLSSLLLPDNLGLYKSVLWEYGTLKGIARVNIEIYTFLELHLVIFRFCVFSFKLFYTRRTIAKRFFIFILIIHSFSLS